LQRIVLTITRYEQVARVYADLLQEIKFRIEAIDAILDGSIFIRTGVGEEICYLQLRFICETIALGCLVMHGDIGVGYEGMRTTYKASYIVNKLARWHKDFYPTPLADEDDHQHDPPELIHLKSGFLTSSDLTKLWERFSGEKLHRGSLKNLSFERSDPDFRLVREWRDKIVRLLNRHFITTIDAEQLYYFVMNDGTGNVGYNLLQKIGKAKPLDQEIHV